MNERYWNSSRTYVTVCKIRKHFIFEEGDNEVVGIIIKRFSHGPKDKKKTMVL
jgi:hypothetical protein